MLSLSVHAADSGQLLALRIGDWPDKVRLVLEADQRIEVEQRYAERRLEIYLRGVDEASLRRVLAATPLDRHRLIDSWQLLARGDGDWLLVLELAGEISPRLRWWAPREGFQYRFVLDMAFGAPGVIAAARPEPAKPAAVEPPTRAPSAMEAVTERLQLRAVRLGRWPDRSRIVIETDRALAFSVPAPAHDGERAVQLSGMDAAALAAALAAQLPANHPLIAAATVAASEQGARVDFRLRRPVTLRAFNLLPENGYGHRLVLDLVTDVAHVSALPSVMPLPAPVPAPEIFRVERPRLDLSVSPSARDTPTTPLEAPVEAPADAAPEVAPEIAPEVAPEVAPVSAEPVDEDAESDLLWLEARLNQQPKRRTVLAWQQAQNRLLLTGEDLRQWRLQVPAQPEVSEQGEAWYSLETLGIAYQLDPSTLTLDLTAPAHLFEGQSLDGPQRQVLEPTPSALGGFLNYDLSASHADSEFTGGGFFETGLFGRWGSVTSTALLREAALQQGYELRRMDTSYRWDDPAAMRTLVVGDTVSRTTAWSGGVRFGGLQWARNFATQPQFQTLPLMTLAGEAALPSVLELYVNNALRLREQLPPGPFNIDEIPVVTGQGEIRLVVRDALGREQVYTEAYYANQSVLQKGLHDWSWDVGAVREDYGIENFSYGRVVAATTHRYGISNRLTGEFHAQWLQDQQLAGAGASWLLPGGGVMQMAAATSESILGRGELFSVGVQRQGRWLSLGVEAQTASDDFLRMGMAPGQPLPEKQVRAYGSTRVPGGGSLSVSWTDQDYRAREDVSFLTLRWGQRLGRIGFVSVTALYYPISQDTAWGTSVSIPLGNASASVSSNHRDGSNQGSLTVQRSLPVGTGFGYRMRVGLGERATQQAGLSWQNDYGTWQFDAARGDSGVATRVGTSGGFGVIGGGVYAARSLRDSFALVRVPGFAGVRVYAENQVVAHTNANGTALVPRLRAYQYNALRIEQADLPLGIRVDGVQRTVAPYWRSGVVVDFPVRQSRDAFFQIALEDGTPLPLGAAVSDASGELWPVGHRGEAFITGLAETNRLRAYHNGKQCEFELAVPDSDDPLPDLGSVICREVLP